MYSAHVIHTVCMYLRGVHFIVDISSEKLYSLLSGN